MKDEYENLNRSVTCNKGNLVMINYKSRHTLQDILVGEPAVLSGGELERAKAAALNKGCSLFDSLVSEGIMTEQQLLDTLCERLGPERIDLTEQKPSSEAISLIPAELVVKRCCIGVQVNKETFQIAVNDPTDYQLLDELRLLLYSRGNGTVIEPVFCLATKESISQSIKDCYGLGAEAVEKLVAETPSLELEGLRTDDDEEAVDMINEEGSSIVQFVNLLIAEAVKGRATDIHIEPFEGKLRIRQRIDGMLHEVSIPKPLVNFTSNIVSRIKVMARLDIAEKRLPQDGRIKVKIDDDKYDLRISVLPSPYGEAINIRILSQHMRFLRLDQLGLEKSGVPIAEDLISRPNGVILVTGPTGSGKTTFLYACLSRINTIDRKILTIEDPIEYRMDGVIQMQTLSKIDFSFARALRSMLRHDPDVMMIGEIRDIETAQITVRSALTGHLVFSTLHTNDASGAVARLIDMGIEPFLAASSLLAVLAIRLVRVLCPACRRQVDLEPSRLEQLGIVEAGVNTEAIYEAAGCAQCRGSGYIGRMGIFEILRVSEAIRDLIQGRVPTSKIKAAAMAEGMKTLRQDGWRKVKRGITSIDEVLRVSGADELIRTGN